MAVKYLVSDKTGDHLPYTDASGSPDHRLMGAAWAALHGGYRGQKYQGSGKESAITKLTGVYKSEKMVTPQESFAVPEASSSLLYEADGVTPKAQSFSAIRDRVQCAIQSAIDAGTDMDMDGDNDCGQYAWVCDLFPTTAVFSMGDSYFQVPYHDENGVVTLGTPVEVEMSYTVVPDDGNDAQESQRLSVGESAAFSEGAYDASTGLLTLTVIKPGFNTSKGRYYPADVLKRDHKIFEGAKMFADHATEAENKQRPEGSVKNWVASVKKVWAESDGTIQAQAAVIDPAFKGKLEELNKQGMLHEMGVSIRAIGEAQEMKIDGVLTNCVESLVRARSVDFVTYAGAGGQVLAIESEHDENDVDLVSEAELRQRRPDLIMLIESNSHKESATVKTLEQQLQESQAQLAAEKQRADAAEKKLTESEKVSKKAAASAELTKLLVESKLPEKAQERLRKQFAEAEKTDGMKEAIELERDYIKSFTGKPAGVRGLGTKENGVEESAKTEVNLVESFMRIPGMTKEKAEIAAAL